MNKAKKQRLAAAGWRVGDVSEFLGLSPQERMFIEIKLALAREFKERRKARNLTQKQVAEMIHSSQSRVAKLEAADSSVTVDLILQSLFALGFSLGDFAKALRAIPTCKCALCQSPFRAARSTGRRPG